MDEAGNEEERGKEERVVKKELSAFCLSTSLVNSMSGSPFFPIKSNDFIKYSISPSVNGE